MATSNLSSELFHAILSMDAYSRGYGGAFDSLSNAADGSLDVGGARIVQTSLIGSFEQLRDIHGNEFVDQQIGFYAIAYDTDEVPDGFADVISFRGTDFGEVIPSPLDVVHGWPLGAGNISSQQGQMAVAFYNYVEQQSGRPNEAITLTGHSLGGGLAGFLSSMLGTTAFVYDSMEYRAAAAEAITSLSYQDFVGENLDETFNFGKVNGYFVEGEFLSNQTLGKVMPQATGTDYINADAAISFYGGLGLDPLQLHSQAALIIALFQKQVPGYANIEAAKQYFVPLLYDDDFALSIGMNAASLSGALQSDEKYANILQRIIAYSALDTGERPFGDTAIRSLYNDADELGRVLNAGSIYTQLFLNLAPDLAKVFVNHTAQLARHDIERTDVPNAENGVLLFDRWERAFAVDLSFDSPSISYAASESSLNSLRDKIVYASVVHATGANFGDTVTIGNRDFNPTGNADIGQVIYKLYGSDGPFAEPIGGGTTMYIGLDGGDRSWGTSGDDFFIGGDGDDEYYTGAGNDTLIGGEGGEDLLDGGEGDDTYVFGADWGTDYIGEEGGFDTLVFTHHTFDDIRLQRDIGVNSSHLTIYERNGNTDVSGQFVFNFGQFSASENFRVERLIDSSGRVVDLTGGLHLRGNDSRDTMAGTGYSDYIETFGQNDTIRSYGDDDSLVGGSGNDTLEGGYGGDTYIFRPGHGKDTIYEIGSGPATDVGPTDTILLDGFLPTDVQMVEDWQGRLTIYTSADYENWIYVPSQFSNYNPGNSPLIERIAFSNGVSIDLGVPGAASNAIPNGVSEAFSGVKGQAFAFTFNSLLANDSDTDIGTDLTISSVDNAVGGSAQIVGQSIQFTPDPGIGGTVGFDYFITDGIATAPVTLAITYPGSIGDDTFLGSPDTDVFKGFGGNDTFKGGLGDDTLNGGSGNDVIEGGEGSDTIYGQDGDDEINGDGGNDNILAGSGDDTVNGGLGNDAIRGSAGLDIINAGAGSDTVFGGDGADTIRGGAGNDTLNGNGGNDLVYGEGGDDTIFGVTGNDTLLGGDGNDLIGGGGGNDVLNGEGGDDTLYGGSNNDTLFGGTGNDLLVGQAQDDDLFGQDGNDILRGGDGFDFLDGGSGSDNLEGGNAGDTLNGGLGADVLRGGAGFDVFEYNSTSESTFTASDTIDGIDGVGIFGGDIIDLSGIDADETVEGNQGFTFLGAVSTAVGSGSGPGSLWLEDFGTQTRLYGNTDFEGIIELAIRINDGESVSAFNYTASDFVL